MTLGSDDLIDTIRHTNGVPSPRRPSTSERRQGHLLVAQRSHSRWPSYAFGSTGWRSRLAPAVRDALEHGQAVDATGEAS